LQLAGLLGLLGTVMGMVHTFETILFLAKTLVTPTFCNKFTIFTLTFYEKRLF